MRLTPGSEQRLREHQHRRVRMVETLVTTGRASEPIKEICSREDPYDYSPSEFRSAQLAAAREMFERMRPLVPVLDRRASETGAGKIETLADLVPLLLSHTAYK